jgi:hypothetical protein
VILALSMVQFRTGMASILRPTVLGSEEHNAAEGVSFNDVPTMSFLMDFAAYAMLGIT